VLEQDDVHTVVLLGALVGVLLLASAPSLLGKASGPA
jgi:hypothetical protein